jgi:glycerophosphoryl diester phosphodiesterase
MAEHWPQLDEDARPALPGFGMTRSIELQGHRGARGLFPENTLAGFAGAL